MRRKKDRATNYCKSLRYNVRVGSSNKYQSEGWQEQRKQNKKGEEYECKETRRNFIKIKQQEGDMMQKLKVHEEIVNYLIGKPVLLAGIIVEFLLIL